MNQVERVITNRIDNGVMADNDVEVIAFHKAIGYLSCWASDSPRYKYLTILHDGNHGDMIACYRETLSDRPTFVMGAIWNKESQSYSFHS